MPRTWSDLQPPKDFDPRHVELWKKLNLQMRDFSSSMGMISRGQVPDGSGAPLVTDDGRFFLLKGRPFGQQAHGATEAGGNLWLSSTYNDTKGIIYLGDAEASMYDEVNNRLGLNTIPDTTLHVIGEPFTQGTTYIVPNGDRIIGGSWTNSDGTSTTLFDYMDNYPNPTAPIMTGYVNIGGSGTSTFDLSAITDPGVSFDSSWTIKIDCQSVGSSVGLATALAQTTGTGLATAPATQTATTTRQTLSYPLDAAHVAAARAYGFANVCLNIRRTGAVVVKIYNVWIEVLTGVDTGGQTVIIKAGSIGDEAMQLVATGSNPLNDIHITTPITTSSPWVISSDGGNGIEFREFDRIAVTGPTYDGAYFTVGPAFNNTSIAAAAYLGLDNTTAVGYVSVTGQIVVQGTDQYGSTEGALLVRGSGGERAVQLHASTSPAQTADIMTVYNAYSTATSGRVFRIDPTGLVGIFSRATTIGAALHVQPISASGKVLIAQGVTSQTGSLQEWQPVGGTPYLTVTAAGRFTVESSGTMRFVPGAGLVDKVLTADTNGDISLNYPMIARKNSTGSEYRRRKFNFIEGTNVTITMADDSTDNEVDITITAAGGAEVENLGMYGNGVDGSVTFDGTTDVVGFTRSGTTYTSTPYPTESNPTYAGRDVYFNNMTIDNGVTVIPDGRRWFIMGTFTNNGTVLRSGSSGTAGSNYTTGTSSRGVGGAGVTASSSRPCGGNTAGSDGKAGTTGSGAATTAPPTACVGEGGSGGGGGRGGANDTGPDNGGAATSGTTQLISRWRNLGTLFANDFLVLVEGGTGGRGGSSGAGDGATTKGGAGGGGGAGGPVHAIWARYFVNNGTITCAGGNGGAGGNGDGVVGAGGGGGGGGGGFLYLVYDTYTNTGTITVAGGTGGAAGTNSGGDINGFNAADGEDGSSGSFVKYCRITGVWS